MSDPLFGALDIGLAFGFVLALAIWQLAVLRRGIRRDREAARREADAP